MRPKMMPPVPAKNGEHPFERFDNLVGRILSVTKSRVEEIKQAEKQKRTSKASSSAHASGEKD